MLWFELALRLGSTVKNLKDNMTQREFSTWCAFDRISPIGDGRQDYHAAQITGMIHATHSSSGSNQPTIEDFKLFSKPKPIDYKLKKLAPEEREFYESFR